MELIDCIKKIPSMIDRFILEWPELRRNLSERIPSAPPAHIIVIGSGSSFNAAKAVQTFLRRELRVEISTLHPSDFLEDPVYYLQPSTIFIFVSQGGGSRQVYDCLSLASEHGCFCIAVSENEMGKISQSADLFVDMRSEQEPYLFRTIGFDMTCIVTVFLVLALSGKSESFEKNWLFQLSETARRMPEIITLAGEWFRENKASFGSVSSIWFIGASELAPIATEADIKFMEMVPVMTRSIELEESIHGPQNAFKRDMMFFFLTNSEEEIAKTAQIETFVREEVHAQTYIVSVLNLEQANSVKLPYGSKDFDFLGSITFFQTIAYYLAISKGRNLEEVIYPNLTKYIKKKF